MEGIEYLEDRKIDKGLLLRLSNSAYIDEGHHIILSGASGCGKSYIIRSGTGRENPTETQDFGHTGYLLKLPT